MQYQKLVSGNTIIEFHNNWLGEETVIVNGQIVSKKSSITGTHHHFTVKEESDTARYVLTTKLDMNMQVLVDLRRNGILIHQDVVVRYGGVPKSPVNKAKKQGLIYLKQYDLEEAVAELQKAVDIDPDDPEIYFHLACAYSVMEKPQEGFECLMLTVKKGLQNTEMILDHDMLAFLRMHPAFEGFLNSNFTQYQL